MLSSSANMFHTSIVTTLHHSLILIWIRLCHIRGLRKWGFFFFFSLFSTHSFSFPLSLSHLHAASSQALWCACFNLELNGICATAEPIGGRITDPRVHCGMPPFWWVGVKIAMKQWRRACSPRRWTAFPMQIPVYWKRLSGYCQHVPLQEVPSVALCYKQLLTSQRQKKA